MLQKHVVLVAADADDALNFRKIRMQVLVRDRPIDDRTSFRDCRRSPALHCMRTKTEIMGRESAQPAAVVDHGSAYAVHHAAEGEREILGRFRFVPAPAWRLILELRTHLGSAVIGRGKLVRLEVLDTPVRPGLQPDDAQPSSRQNRGYESAHAADANQDDVGLYRRRRGAPLRVEAGDLLVTLPLPQRGRNVGKGLNAAALGHGLRGKVLFRTVLQPYSGVAEKSPAELVAVATIRRIAEEPFLQMRTYELKNELWSGTTQSGIDPRSSSPIRSSCADCAALANPAPYRTRLTLSSSARPLR